MMKKIVEKELPENVSSMSYLTIDKIIAKKIEY